MHVIVVAILIIAGGVLGTGVWANNTENNCWKYEAKLAFEKYGTLKTRSEVLRAANVEKNKKSNPIDVIEGDDYNGCSLGSNGMTAIRFYFDDQDKLTAIQVWRNYSGVETQLIEEKKF
ncbi:MAG TPA: hypothetical protein VIU93_15305 [Gallionellaceae bacterium]